MAAVGAPLAGAHELERLRVKLLGRKQIGIAVDSLVETVGIMRDTAKHRGLIADHREDERGGGIMQQPLDAVAYVLDEFSDPRLLVFAVAPVAVRAARAG